MAFGRRRQDAGSQPRPTSANAEVVTEQQRLEAFRDHLKSLLTGAGRIADAVRGETSVPMPVALEDPDPASGPLALKAFHSHFIKIADRSIKHSVLAYRLPTADTVDPNAQFHLHLLTGRVMEFNLFCQRADIDQALGVALQSPSVPAMLDAIMVQAAFFTALVDTMIALLPGDDGQHPAVDLAAHKTNLDRHLLMASDKMFDPAKLQGLLPLRTSPLLAVEIDNEPHDGDYFINGVYFPAAYARVLLDDGNQASAAA